jgi:hypothetical protein
MDFTTEVKDENGFLIQRIRDKIDIKPSERMRSSYASLPSMRAPRCS